MILRRNFSLNPHVLAWTDLDDGGKKHVGIKNDVVGPSPGAPRRQRRIPRWFGAARNLLVCSLRPPNELNFHTNASRYCTVLWLLQWVYTRRGKRIILWRLLNFCSNDFTFFRWAQFFAGVHLREVRIFIHYDETGKTTWLRRIRITWSINAPHTNRFFEYPKSVIFIHSPQMVFCTFAKSFTMRTKGLDQNRRKPHDANTKQSSV